MGEHLDPDVCYVVRVIRVRLYDSFDDGPDQLQQQRFGVGVFLGNMMVDQLFDRRPEVDEFYQIATCVGLYGRIATQIVDLYHKVRDDLS